MNTASFLLQLRAHATLPLIFRSADMLVPPGYHLTEVKRVGYETMDCGAQLHRWSETHFELWVPPLASVVPGRGYMPTAKFLAIIDRVERELPLVGETPARIHAALADGPAALYDVTAVTAVDGELHVVLTPDRTRCKSAERRLAAATGGCCARGETDGEQSPAAASACCV